MVCDKLISCSFSKSFVNFSELEFVSMCRGCSDVDKWRCDNGWCIPENKLFDGIPDCPDASDEHTRKSIFPFKQIMFSNFELKLKTLSMTSYYLALWMSDLKLEQLSYNFE